MLELLQRWSSAAERLVGRLPELAALLGSWPAALLAAAAGVALLVAGMRLGRVLAATGAAVVGALAGAALAPNFDLWNLPAATPIWGAAGLLGLLALAAPELYPVVLGLVPGALLGMRFSLAGSSWLAAAAGGAALAGVALLLRRLVLAATAASAGAVLVATALLALSRKVAWLRSLTDRLVLLLAVAALLAVAGTAFQVVTARRAAPSSAFGQRGFPLRD